MAAAPTEVQYKITDSITANPTCTFTSAQTAGNMNLLLAQWSVGDPPTSVTDSKGNQYTLVIVHARSDQPNTGEALFYCPSIVAATAGSNTVTCHSDSTDIEIVIIEIHGGVAIDGAVIIDQTINTTTCTGSTTLHYPNELAYAYESDVSAPGDAAGPGWNQHAGFPANFQSILESQTFASAGSISATVTMASGMQGGTFLIFGITNTPLVSTLPTGTSGLLTRSAYFI